MSEPTSNDSARVTFDPAQHLTRIKGQDYLEVKWRLTWFREEHPDGVIETELRSIENGRAVFYARVSKTSGGTATGWGSCTVDEFDAFVEKAETKAVGRALAALGYGTASADDWDDTGALADAPVGQRNTGGGNAGGDLATSAQKSMIQYKARQAHLEPDELVQFIQQQTGKPFNELTKRDASRVIDALGAQPTGPQPMRRPS